MAQFGVYKQGEMAKDGQARTDFVSIEAADADSALKVALKGANDPKVMEIDPTRPDRRRFSVQLGEGRQAYRIDPIKAGRASASGVGSLNKAQLLTLVQSLGTTAGLDSAALDTAADAIRNAPAS